jgi:hypothetical protein
MDRLFREFHHAIRWLNDRSDEAGTTIDQNGTAGDTREMSDRIEVVQDVWLRLKQLESNG